MVYCVQKGVIGPILRMVFFHGLIVFSLMFNLNIEVLEAHPSYVLVRHEVDLYPSLPGPFVELGALALVHVALFRQDLPDDYLAVVDVEHDVVVLPDVEDLRRTFGQRALNEGQEIHDVSLVMGHSSVATTQGEYCDKDLYEASRDMQKFWNDKEDSE